MSTRSVMVYGLAAVLLCGTYPLALLCQLGVDVMQGDAPLARELLYGHGRVALANVATAWLGSLLWVLGTWLAIEALRRAAPRLYTPLILLLGGAVLGVAATRLAPVPPIFGWLLLAALLLHRIHSLVSTTYLRREVVSVTQP